MAKHQTVFFHSLAANGTFFSEKLKKKIQNRLETWKIEVVLENQYRKWGFHQNLAKSVFEESGKAEKNYEIEDEFVLHFF